VRTADASTGLRCGSRIESEEGQSRFIHFRTSSSRQRGPAHGAQNGRGSLRALCQRMTVHWLTPKSAATSLALKYFAVFKRWPLARSSSRTIRRIALRSCSSEINPDYYTPT
jgi:hypothetical protein